MRTVRRTGTLILASLLGLALGGCGSAGERSVDASAAATEFERLLSSADFKGLCAALAPETRSELAESEKTSCAEAIAAQDIPFGGAVRKVDVYGRQARVVLESDTLFLSQFRDGWKVVAAGCTPRSGGLPYQCTIKGG
ncbi:hypothetical protein [Streptomyces spinoverrucosus]|uniref:hypothetical protein n=1 Tax=Streptomyces spinoverrucosus TaxID=284043 RepID=UPI001E3A71E6|nr:hypothetical protein [Streptomyces spinoverrucosus]